MFRKLLGIFLLGLFLIPSNFLLTNTTDFKPSTFERIDYSYTIIPIMVYHIVNFSVELKLEESFTTLMNSEYNFFIITVFGSNTSGLYDAVVLFGNSSGKTFVDYSFASDISVEPLTFAVESFDMIQSNENLVQLTFGHYAVYKTYPVIVSALALFSTDTVLQFEADFQIYLNDYFNPYFSNNQLIVPISLQDTTSSISSNSSKGGAIGFNSILLVAVLPFLCLYYKKRKF